MGFVLCFLAFTISFLNGIENTDKPDKIWALLIAGSSGYDNYRHQADVAHAYQIIKRNKIPSENTIVMIYDDIANDPENPTPGVIINRPNGTNVYEGIQKDYTSDTITPRHFLRILEGDESKMKGIGSGKVIKSGPNDDIFVNFVDHGGPGVLGFPSDVLHAADLHNTLSKMYNETKFRKMVLYVEACHSGSMFDGILEKYDNIFVMTAANSDESSYACYYDNERGTYLGDVFSVNWMQDVDKDGSNEYSLQQLFQEVRKQTNTSHVEEYGDLDIKNSKLSQFIGISDKVTKEIIDTDSKIYPDVVDNYDVSFVLKYRKLMRSGNNSSKRKAIRKELSYVLKRRKLVDEIFDKIIRKITDNNRRLMEALRSQKVQINKGNMNCNKDIIESFSNHCLNVARNRYTFSKLYLLVNTCNVEWTSTSAVKKAIESTCEGIEEYKGIN